MTKVVDLTAAPGEEINTDPEEGDLTPVTTRTYTFDKNGNRTKLVTSVNGTQTATRSWAYDAADRLGRNIGYIYDGLGRQTKIPEIDAPRTNTAASAKGDITIGYYADDAARSITRNGITTTIERDPAGRRLNLTGSGTGNEGKETKHYADDSDNPAWSTRTVGTTTTTTRYESTIGGDLALTITDNKVELAVNNPHGDTVTTIPLTGTGAGQGINGWAQYDEYVNQLSDTVNTGATTYGWHGADQRALDASGLILMGARLYNSVTGLFTSRDPVEGGNSTTYAHPQDPIGMNDISGLFSWRKRAGFAAGWLGRISTVASFVPAAICAVCGGIAVTTGLASAGLHRLSGNKQAARQQLVSTAVGVAFGGFGKLAWKAKKVGRHVKVTRKAKVWKKIKRSNLDYAIRKMGRSGGRKPSGNAHRIANQYVGFGFSYGAGHDNAWKRSTWSRRR